MLASVIRKQWLALCRDVLALGYRVSDMFTTLTWQEMLAIVVGAPPQSSVRWFLDQGWTREAHLLANMQEGTAGLANLTEPYARPGMDDRQPDSANAGFFQTDSYTREEFDELQKKRYQKGRKPGNTRVRTL
jgi:hypothetical protein